MLQINLLIWKYNKNKKNYVLVINISIIFLLNLMKNF